MVRSGKDGREKSAGGSAGAREEGRRRGRPRGKWEEDSESREWRRTGKRRPETENRGGTIDTLTTREVERNTRCHNLHKF